MEVWSQYSTLAGYGCSFIVTLNSTMYNIVRLVMRRHLMVERQFYVCSYKNVVKHQFTLLQVARLWLIIDAEILLLVKIWQKKYVCFSLRVYFCMFCNSDCCSSGVPYSVSVEPVHCMPVMALGRIESRFDLNCGLNQFGIWFDFFKIWFQGMRFDLI